MHPNDVYIEGLLIWEILMPLSRKADVTFPNLMICHVALPIFSITLLHYRASPHSSGSIQKYKVEYLINQRLRFMIRDDGYIIVASKFLSTVSSVFHYVSFVRFLQVVSDRLEIYFMYLDRCSMQLLSCPSA